ncbi:MAG: hypothetical protein ABI878_08595 [Acidobacteriota bacterium]
MTKHFTKLALAVLCGLFVAQFCFAQNLIDAEEYAVYSDLLKKTYGDDATSNFAIHKNISAKFIEDDNEYIVRKLSPIDVDLIKDFNERNNSEAEIQNRFNLKSKVYLVGDELKEIFKSPQTEGELIEEKDWEAFRKQYQAFSLLSLSRVGFNKKRDKALVVLGSQYGYLAGDGFYYLLVKKRSGWKIKNKVRAWIS